MPQLLRLIAAYAERAHLKLCLQWNDKFRSYVLTAEITSLDQVAEYVTLEWNFRVKTIRQVCSLLE